MLGSKEQLRILAILRAVYGRHGSAQLTMGQLSQKKTMGPSFQQKKLWGNHGFKKKETTLCNKKYTTLFILHNFSSGPNLKEYKSWVSKVATVCQM
jgi:hypothetical protein